MRIENNTIVSLRYKMRNDAGEIMEDNTNAASFEYVHGSGNLFPALENAMIGLSAGETKSFSISDKLLRGVFHFEVIVDNVRTASGEEIEKGIPSKPLAAGDCGPDCNC
jgi:FKBP-type peptidyl-prolyl cis-trans isomerase SlyD